MAGHAKQTEGGIIAWFDMARASKALLVGALGFALFVGALLTYLFWPYPHVTRTGEPALVNLPESGYYQTGDDIGKAQIIGQQQPENK